MFLTEFLKEIELNFSFLKDYGFAQQKVDPSLSRYIWFEKHSSSEGFKLMFHWTQYGEKFYIKEVRAEKRFNTVESEIARTLSRKTEDLYTINLMPDLETIPKELDPKMTSAGIESTILNKDHLIEFASFFKKFYQEHVTLFFKRYSDLSAVNAELAILLERQEIQTLLTSVANSTMLRFYCIAALYNNVEMLDFMSKVYFPYLEENIHENVEKTESERFKVLMQNLRQS
ncbi:hypothetical protein [Pseudochryseolinea flava]|uniref:DUF4304 domain-containing protein n=1 Tax=Pseudochryseolinea flava TaxID=2059302 RepID=A0A364Y5L8_9BACT|nr:hypothetical protein [Pseudochryseolinea flava]RAW02132.1 hypothetical protein DQQ10_06175 [Pseudochryseolinea flava]